MRFQELVYRAHNPEWSWTPLSGEGARRHGGRFNRRGVPALYLAFAAYRHSRSAAARPANMVAFGTLILEGLPLD